MTTRARTASQELAARLAAERDKATRKYGPDALAPGGDPTRDVLDYVINEVAGLVRYGEMLAHRAGAIAALAGPEREGRALRSTARQLEREAEVLVEDAAGRATRLIMLRNRLLGFGPLGDPEDVRWAAFLDA